MSDPESHPMSDWPPDLQQLWNTFARSGEVDAQHPPATVQEAYNQVVEVQVRHMQEAMQDVACLVAESELLPVNLRRKLAVCARCGAGDLEHFYTAKRTGRTLCAACFHQGVEQGLAQNPASADS